MKTIIAIIWVQVLPLAALASDKDGNGEVFAETVTVNGENVEIVLRSGPFVSNDHVLDQKNWQIDGRRPIGVDGHVVTPQFEIKSISVKWGERQIAIPEDAWSDVYSPCLIKPAEPLFDREGVHLLVDEKSDAIMIRMVSYRWASAGYCVYWSIGRNGFHSRFVENTGQ